MKYNKVSWVVLCIDVGGYRGRTSSGRAVAVQWSCSWLRGLKALCRLPFSAPVYAEENDDLYGMLMKLRLRRAFLRAM